MSAINVCGDEFIWSIIPKKLNVVRLMNSIEPYYIFDDTDNPDWIINEGEYGLTFINDPFFKIKDIEFKPNKYIDEHSQSLDHFDGMSIYELNILMNITETTNLVDMSEKLINLIKEALKTEPIIYNRHI